MIPTRAPRAATRTLAAALLGAAALTLAGCAAMRTVTSDVTTFGEWPAGRAPGTYAFERLPSQQARGAETEALENAARPALEKAGFRAAAPGAAPDVTVQVGSRTQLERGPWSDPYWYGGFGYWRRGPWLVPSWSVSARYEPRRYESEVAVLIRDRENGKALYEARAVSDWGAPVSQEVTMAMFQAALMDFPKTGVNPRKVSVQMP
jgi:hypothetical protein